MNIKRCSLIIATLLFSVLLALFISGCKEDVDKNQDIIDTKSTPTFKVSPTPMITIESTINATTAFPTETSNITSIVAPTPSSTADIPSSSTQDTKDIKPLFSLEAGFYHGNPSVEVSLSSSDIAILKSNNINNYTIKVSFSQEEPTFNSSSYKTPIKLPSETSQYDPASKFTTTVLRAGVFDSNGNLIGKIHTATYIKSSRSESVSLPVISLVTEHDNLYDEETGIITNYNQRGSEWERPVHVEFFEKNEMVISQDAGIRIFGGSSRSLPQKSFRITARKSSYFNVSQYDGAGKFKYALFPNRLKANGTELAEYDSFVLRNGGNDSVVNNSAQNERTSLIRDGMAALIANSSCSNLDSMAYRPVVVFLNGQYYGILNMREHENDNYIANVYDIEDKENITVISSELNTENGTRYDGSWFFYKQDEGPEGELDKFINVLKNIKEGKYSYDQASRYIDMDNFIEYCAINLFICNTDWPHNNVRVWKYADGKYKFMLRDADLGMARYTISAGNYNMPAELYTKAEAQNLRYLLWPCLSSTQKTKLYNPEGLPSVDIGTYQDPLYIQSLLHFCLQNEGFKTKFISFCEKLATVLWGPDHLLSLLYERRSIIEVEMQFHFAKWAEHISEAHYSYWFETTIGGSMAQWMNKRSGANGYFLDEIYEVCNTYK